MTFLNCHLWLSAFVTCVSVKRLRSTGHILRLGLAADMWGTDPSPVLPTVLPTVAALYENRSRTTPTDNRRNSAVGVADRNDGKRICSGQRCDGEWNMWSFYCSHNLSNQQWGHGHQLPSEQLIGSSPAGSVNGRYRHRGNRWWSGRTPHFHLWALTSDIIQGGECLRDIVRWFRVWTLSSHCLPYPPSSRSYSTSSMVPEHVWAIWVARLGYSNLVVVRET